MKTSYAILLLACISFVSCTPQYSYFTESLYKKQNWDAEDVQQIQFYVSKDIVLTRAISEGETRIAQGKISIKDGRKIERVVVKQGTPGVLVIMPKEDRFGISFEEEGSEHYLMFGPNPKYYNRYALLAQDWDREKGKVHYGGQLYDVDAASAFSSLLVDLRRSGGQEYQSRKVQGRLVKGG